MQPLVSVIIPIYNVEKYLPECLDSVIGQTYENLEIICVNDGSPDNSLAILNDYAAKDARIKVINKQNGGLSSAKNAGMACATGDFIAFVDSDDYIEPQCIETCMKHFDADVDVVAFSFSSIRDGIVESTYHQQLKGKFTFSSEMMFQLSWNVWANIYRKSTLDKYGMSFREGILWEDLEFNSRFFLTYNPTIICLEDYFYNYRQNPNSITGKAASLKEGMGIQLIYILDSIHDYLKKHESLARNIKTFKAICEYCFRSACLVSPAHEQAKCYAEMTTRLRRWNLDYSDYPRLSALFHGDYIIKFNDDIRKRTFKGMDRIFCVRNEGNHKVVRLFTMKIASKRRKKR